MGAGAAVEEDMEGNCFKKYGKCHDQGRCGNIKCESQASTVCSMCTQPTIPTQKQAWFCNKIEEKCCFAANLYNEHNIGTVKAKFG